MSHIMWWYTILYLYLLLSLITFWTLNKQWKYQFSRTLIRNCRHIPLLSQLCHTNQLPLKNQKNKFTYKFFHVCTKKFYVLKTKWEIDCQVLTFFTNLAIFVKIWHFFVSFWLILQKTSTFDRNCQIKPETQILAINFFTV